MLFNLIGLAALILAIYLFTRLSAMKEQVDRIGYSRDYLENAVKDLRKEMQLGLSVTRQHLSRVAKGEKLNEQMVLEGMPFADLIADTVQAILEKDPKGYFVLDVRTPGEYASGHIAGATLIPVDDLERRAKELPTDKATPLIVYCQGGVRSATACDYLSSVGYANLTNMANGMGAWRGPVER